MRRICGALVLALGALQQSCSNESHPPPLEGTSPGNSRTDVGGQHEDAGQPTTPDASPVVDAAGDAGADLPIFENCGEVVCAGTKRCVQEETRAYCDCDEGFIQVSRGGGDFDCVLDEDCRRLRVLHAGCRQMADDHPVVYTSYQLSYCAGIPVPSAEVDLPADVFTLQQDDERVDPTESYTAFGAANAETFVTVALDVSDSVTSAADVLEPLIDRLRQFVDDIRPEGNEPPVTFSMIIFGRTVGSYLQATTDLDAVDAQLGALAAEGATAVEDIVQTNGTALFDAVEAGIDVTEAAQAARFSETGGASLTVGTLLVITDGNNRSGSEQLNQGLIEDTSVNIVSMGINDQIDDTQLTAIGRDGSFLAPLAEDWSETFAETADRIRTRTDSVYQVAYCSPSTEGRHELAIALVDDEDSAASCDFDADAFATGVTGTCQERVAGVCEIANAGNACGAVMACDAACAWEDVCEPHENCVINVD